VDAKTGDVGGENVSEKPRRIVGVYA